MKRRSSCRGGGGGSKEKEGGGVVVLSKQRQPLNNGGSLEIKDGKDGVMKRCSNNSCRDVVPICCLKVSSK